MPHRLQQSLHLVELLLAHPGLHLDLTNDPLESLQPAVREGQRSEKDTLPDKLTSSSYLIN